MLCTQFVERCVAADFETFMEDDAARFQPINAAHDNRLFEFEARNTISQQAPCAVMPVVNMDFIPGDAHIFGSGKARWPRANNTDRLSARGPRDDGFDPAFFPCRIGDEFFDRADRHRAVARKFDDAIALAQAILRADAAADFGHRRCAVRQFIGFAQPPFGGQPQPVGDVIVQRTMDRAIRNAALRTARRLLLGTRHGISVGDLAEILGAACGLPLLRIRLRLVDKFQHRVFGHRALRHCD